MDWAAPQIRGPLDVTVTVPPSKSIHQRVLVLSALADTPPSVLTVGDAEEAHDVVQLRNALNQVGTWSGDAWGDSRESTSLDLGLCGAGFRFSMAAAALRRAGSRTRIFGRTQLMRRPHRPLRRALRSLGVQGKRRSSGAMRIVAPARREGSQVYASASQSSQYVSALALMASRWGGLDIRMERDPVSLPYIEVTRATLAQFGLSSTWTQSHRERVLSVEAGVPTATSIAIEPDASSAAFWWGLVWLIGGSVTVKGLSRESSQADMRLLDLIASPENVSANSSEDAHSSEDIVFTRDIQDHELPSEIDLRQCSDLVPIVAALATQSPGETRLVGAEHVRWKESHRLNTVAAGIRAIGGAANVEGSELVVGDRPVTGGTVQCCGDHRLVMGFGLLSACNGAVRLAGADTVKKSYPSFMTDFERLATGQRGS